MCSLNNCKEPVDKDLASIRMMPNTGLNSDPDRKLQPSARFSRLHTFAINLLDFLLNA